MKRCVFELLAVMVLTPITACREPYKTVQVASTMQLSRGWTEISPNKPLSLSEPTEEVVFTVDPPHSFDRDLFPVLSNGTKCPVSVAILDDRGRSYALNGPGLIGGDMFFDTFDTLVPRDVHYIQKIRFKSGCDMEISNVIWRGYDFSKVKR